MQRLHHLGGMAAMALTALGLSACYPPPPGTVAAAPPGAVTELPPQPYVPPTATNPPYPLTGAVGPQPYGPTTLPGAAIPSNAIAAGSLATGPLELERRTVCLDRRPICAAARANSELGPRLLAARAERLGLERRPLGIARHPIGGPGIYLGMDPGPRLR
jgi:hypothetical protein